MNKIVNMVESAVSESLIKVFEYHAPATEINIEIPNDRSHGDYATNVAMRLAKQLKLNPKAIAEKLVIELQQNNELFAEVSIAGPGFINFRIQTAVLSTIINDVIAQNDSYGTSQDGKMVKVNVEYVSANPTGDLHPGHARGAATGDSLTRMMKFAGYDVTREYYLNDGGVQIDKLASSLQARYLNLFNIDVQVPEDGYHGADIIDIAEQLKNEVADKYVSEDLMEYHEQFKAYGLQKETQKLEDDLALFRVGFDVWTKESTIYQAKRVEEVLAKLQASGYTYELDDALWLKTTEFGDDKDRVIIKSDGNYTYLTPDIAYHQDKYDRGYDLLVDLLGADHHGYINRLKAAIQILGYDRNQIEVDITQMATMIKDGKEFKMSKRSGQSISLRELIEEVGVDALRYFFVNRASDSPMDLDLDLAIKQSNENPVYYAQYAHARMCSIINQGVKYEIGTDFTKIKEVKEIELLMYINEFPSIIADVAKTRQPHKVCNYIQKLSSYFHSFYGAHKVLDPQDEVMSSQRLGLVRACKITLKNALMLIGVEAPEIM